MPYMQISPSLNPPSHRSPSPWRLGTYLLPAPHPLATAPHLLYNHSLPLTTAHPTRAPTPNPSCGEGEVTQAVVALLPTHCHSLATDINALAARKAGALLRSAADILTADLFTSFAPATVFDIVLFNPPYVPTDASELQRALTSRDISASWAGGPPNGRHIIDNFLRALPNFMSSTSIAYLVLVHENDPDDVHALAERLGLRAKIVLSRKAGLETLYIMRFILFS